ncbi:hypothetical protein [Nonomuraea sp. NPDC049028]|uniref:hypothetical protein n=1 Tax=Nonomuraea sp. NPDC049028 TaxID=3364348 RepID=UPI0037183D67
MGEKFTVRVTGRNGAPRGAGVPIILFRNPAVSVTGTEYAKLVGNGTDIKLSDKELYPGEQSYKDIEMEALRAISVDPDRTIAKARIVAHLDESLFFSIYNYSTVNHDIMPS